MRYPGHSGFDADVYSGKDHFANGSPFWKQADKQATTVAVIVHGFTATPFECRPIAEACVARGIDAVAPLLPGHGIADPVDARKAIRKARAAEWIASVESEITRARNDYQNVVVAGQSMGGLLALIAAATQGVSACAVCSPAMQLPWHARWGSRLFGWTGLKVAKKLEGRNARNPQYSFYHLGAVGQLRRVAERAREAIGKINCPVWAAHAERDPLLPSRVIDILEEGLPAKPEVHFTKCNSHCLPLSNDGPEICQQIAGFFEKQLTRNQHAA